MESDTPRTILIVDDNEVTLQTYAKTLQLEGYAVRTAADAAAGWRELAQGRPDALILDLRLPEAADGLQFLRDLRVRDGGATPVAVATGDYGLSARVEDEIRALGARLVFKPLWVETLIELASELVRTEPPPTACMQASGAALKARTSPRWGD